MPVVLQFREGYAQLFLEQVAGMESAVTQDVVHGHELRLAVLDHHGVGREHDGAFGEGVEGVDGLVGRDVVGQLEHYFDLGSAVVVDLLDLYLAGIVGRRYRRDNRADGLAEGDVLDHQGLLVTLCDGGADTHAAAAQAAVVFAAVGYAACGKIGVEVELLALEGRDAGIQKFVEVVGEDEDLQADADTLAALGQQ